MFCPSPFLSILAFSLADFYWVRWGQKADFRVYKEILINLKYRWGRLPPLLVEVGAPVGNQIFALNASVSER